MRLTTFNRSLSLSLGLILALGLGCRTPQGQSDGSSLEAAATPSPTITYGELAKQQLTAVFAATTAQARTFNDETLPQNARGLRKSFGKARAYIDILVYALPGDKKHDFFLELRPLLDEGYEKVGNFKDLHDIPEAAGQTNIVYDPKEVAARRADVDKFLSKYLAPEFQKQLADFLGDISAANAWTRDKDDLSKLFWRQVAQVPKFNTPASDALHALTKGQIVQLQQAEPALLALGHLISDKDIDDFHNFRKRSRVILDMYDFFPTVLAPSAQAKDQLSILKDLVSKYGQLHDRLVGYQDAVKARSPKTADLLIQLDIEWAAVKAWQKKTLHLATLSL